MFPHPLLEHRIRPDPSHPVFFLGAKGCVISKIPINTVGSQSRENSVLGGSLYKALKRNGTRALGSFVSPIARAHFRALLRGQFLKAMVLIIL
jgi:hypothetical protein